MIFHALSSSKIIDLQESVRRVPFIILSKLAGMPETSRVSQQLEGTVND
jgi:hypothetical protein